MKEFDVSLIVTVDDDIMMDYEVENEIYKLFRNSVFDAACVRVKEDPA